MAGGSGYSENDRIGVYWGYGFDANATFVEGSLMDIQVNKEGFNIPRDLLPQIWDQDYNNTSSGTGAVIKPIYFSGLLTVEANTSFTDQQTGQAQPLPKNYL